MHLWTTARKPRRTPTIGGMPAEPLPGRFLTIPQVAEELATSDAQITALIRRGDLVAMKLGGRGQWRIERTKLEEYIAKAYEETARELEERRGDDAADELDTE